MELNIDVTFDGKVTCSFKNKMRNLANLTPQHVWESKNWDCDGIILSKVENVWA